MRIISRKRLIDFWEKHANAKGPLSAWYSEAESAQWNTTHDIKKQYNSADFVEDNRVIFNIGGNNYRLVVKVMYKPKTIYILWVGTHADYDKIDVKKVKP